MDLWATSIITTKSTHKYRRRVIKVLIPAILVVFFIGLSQMWDDNYTNFIVYYGDIFPKECEKEYNVFILSPHTQANITKLADKHLIAGYLSLGEVDSKQPYFKEISHKNFVLHNNPFWSDAKLVDVRDTAWHGFILDEMIPNLIEKGFNGLFLDALDSALELERTYPVRYKGSTESLISLIKKIKQL